MIPAEQLDKACAVDIAVAAERLGAVLRRISASERVGPCIVCGGRDRFSVNIVKQVWHCRGCGAGGGAIDLVRHIRGCLFGEAVEFLTGGGSMPVPQSPLRPTGPEPKPLARKGAADVERVVAGIVRGIVRDMAPLRPSPGEDYLREARLIDADAIADVLERTDGIGWHPSVLFREDGHALNGRRLGCIIGVMTDPFTARPTGAISRTYLSEGRKVGPGRTLGAPAGIVRLTPDEDVLEGLHLAEGLETALAAMAMGFRPIWSTGSAGLMASFPVLAGVECLTIFADNDASGAGLIAANEAAARWLDAGREVHVYQREIEGDLNDAYREGRG